MDGSTWEIEEEEDQAGASEPGGAIHTFPVTTTNGDDVFVAIGKKSSSMEALSWALKHVATPSSLVYLIHVFPEVHYIPTPLGRLPKNQLSSSQVEIYMSQERTKRREALDKFVNLCQASMVKVDALLVESDLVAKAVVELISVLHIKVLIVGSSKSNLRMFRGSSKAEQIQKGAPQYCEVKIICDGKEVATIDQATSSSRRSIISTNATNPNENTKTLSDEDSTSCNCFSKKI